MKQYTIVVWEDEHDGPMKNWSWASRSQRKAERRLRKLESMRQTMLVNNETDPNWEFRLIEVDT